MNSPSLRAWAACVSLCYPLFLSSHIVVNALPELARAAFTKDELRQVQVSYVSIRARSAPADTANARSRRSEVWVATVAAAGAAAALALAAPRTSFVAGLAIAMLGYVGSLPWLRGLLLRREFTVETIAAAILFLAIQAVGLRRLAGPGRYARRLSQLSLSFVFPLAALQAAFSAFQRFPSSALLLLAPGAVATALASVRAARRAPAPTWRPAAAGVLLTLAALAAIARTAPALERARQDRARAVAASVPEIPSDLPYEKLFFQKGVTLTAEWPDVYASQSAGRTLELLADYGVNAVALVPYGFNALGSTRVSMAGRGSWESDDGLEYLSRLAHQRGMKVLLKPQLWVGGRSYPGQIEFSEPDSREKWFAAYGEFVEHYAVLAERIHADLFAVGVELARMTPYEREWRALIERVRRVYPGPLVYAANFGAEFETVEFWDSLDYIGLNNYYPLPDDLSTAGIARQVEAVHRRFGKPVIFTEAGFSSFQAPHRRPWDETPRALAPDEQARCYEALLSGFYSQPWFHGVYWWKVGTDRRGGPSDGSHTPWGKPAMQVIANWYRLR